MIKGVNLGNWLVLEKWMSPGLFAGTQAEDETQLCSDLGDAAKHERLREHRDTYITEKDFAYLASRGIEAVRIPVPFFIFGGYPPYVGCIEYLDRAFEWAEAHDIKVLIDLHTVPDSQNGFDNGGMCGVCKWHKNPAYVEFALTVLERLTHRYQVRPARCGHLGSPGGIGMTATIRAIRPSDYRPVISVIDDWWGGRQMADMLPRLFFEHFCDTCFAAEHDGDLAGFLVGFRSQSRSAEAYIHFVGVRPGERGRGLGRQLYECFFAAVRARDCHLVRAVTSPVNTASVRFHQQLGFAIEPGDAQAGGVPVTAGYDGAGQDRVRFIKHLTT